ncbi:BrnA antitoxin family protein [Rhodobacteraceae bacterium nBUS_24]|nr:hypothetical protein [Marinovum sp.]
MRKQKPFTDESGEVRELEHADLKDFTPTRGRPMIPAKPRKKRINLMLDPDVVEKLKATGNMSNHTNKVLRDFFGL